LHSKLKESACCSVAKRNNVIRIKVSIPEIREEKWKVAEMLIPSYSTMLTGKTLTRAQSKCL
jgi:hypothetical protein